MNRLNNFILFIASIVMIVSGFVIYGGEFYFSMTLEVHRIFAIIFTICVIIHVVRYRKVRKKISKV